MPKSAREFHAAFRELRIVAAARAKRPLHEAIEQLHAHFAGEMVVADARLAQRGIGGPGARAQMAGARAATPIIFSSISATSCIGEPKIAMASLFHGGDQAAGLQLGQMGTRRLRGDARFVGELAGGQRLAAHQRRQHVGARGIAGQRGNRGDARGLSFILRS